MLISFRDTKIRGNVDLTAEFSSFDIPITAIEASNIETDIECSIDITIFLCGIKDEIPSSDDYGLG